MEFRRIFDTIPEKFDKYRPRYCKEAFNCIIDAAHIGDSDTPDGRKTVLELGPGTGQTTEPILATGCSYTAIELGKNFSDMLQKKYGHRDNFSLINDDFITYDFENQRFDLIYSAATIQWIPEETAFTKTFDLLKSGGVLAMMLIKSDYKTPNEALYSDIQKIYDQFWRPAERYSQKFVYSNAVNYGFTDFRTLEFYSSREFTADEYVEYAGTHCDHINILPEYRDRFFDGLHEAVIRHGGKVKFDDKIIVHLAVKP